MSCVYYLLAILAGFLPVPPEASQPPQRQAPSTGAYRDAILRAEPFLENCSRPDRVVPQPEVTTPPLAWKGFFEVIRTIPLNAEEQGELLFRLVGSQYKDPTVTVEDLCQIFAAKRDSIESFSCEYVNEGHDRYPGKQSFAFDGSKLYWGGHRVTQNGEIEEVYSYDGELIRIGSKQDDRSRGQILESFPLSKFYFSDMPLVTAMIADPTLTDTQSTGGDFEIYVRPELYAVYAGKQMIDGIECILVASSVHEIYLAPKMNFGIVQTDYYEMEYEKGGDVMLGRRLAFRRKMSDFKDYGNGVWLPNEVRTKYYMKKREKDKLKPVRLPSGLTDPTSVVRFAYEQVSSVAKMEINPELDPDMFVEIFDGETKVLDGPRRLSYLHGERNSIGDLVTQEVTPKKSRLWVLWANVTAVAVILCVFLWRRHYA